MIQRDQFFHDEVFNNAALAGGRNLEVIRSMIICNESFVLQSPLSLSFLMESSCKFALFSATLRSSLSAINA